MRIHQGPDESYIILFAQKTEFALQYEPGGYGIGYRALPPGDGETWEHFSIVYYDGALDVYRDDELWLGIDVDDPFYPSGSASVASQNSEFHLDNIVFCSLSEPYVPPVVEEVVEE
jgi:hypothetical protein